MRLATFILCLFALSARAFFFGGGSSGGSDSSFAQNAYRAQNLDNASGTNVNISQMPGDLYIGSIVAPISPGLKLSSANISVGGWNVPGTLSLWNPNGRIGGGAYQTITPTGMGVPGFDFGNAFFINISSLYAASFIGDGSQLTGVTPDQIGADAAGAALAATNALGTAAFSSTNQFDKAGSAHDATNALSPIAYQPTNAAVLQGCFDTTPLMNLWTSLENVTGFSGTVGGHILTIVGTNNAKLEYGDDVVTLSDQAQYFVLQVFNGTNVVVLQALARSYTNSDYVVYGMGDKFYDVVPRVVGGIRNDGGIIINQMNQFGNSGGLILNGGTNTFMLKTYWSVYGPFLGFQTMFGTPFSVSTFANYDSLMLLSNSMVSVWFGFTNVHGATLDFYNPLMVHTATMLITNDGTTGTIWNGQQASAFGYDANGQTIYREGGQNVNNYYSYGGTAAAGKGHRFFTGGLKSSQGLRFQIADDKVVSYAPFSATNGIATGTNTVMAYAHVSGTNVFWSTIP